MKAWLVRELFDEIAISLDHYKPQKRDDEIYAPYWDCTKEIRDCEDLIPAELAAKVTWEGEPLQVEIEIKEVRNETHPAKSPQARL